MVGQTYSCLTLCNLAYVFSDGEEHAETEMDNEKLQRAREYSQRTADTNHEDDNIVGNMDVNKAKFPLCITWTPLPLITWLIPCIGHTGICPSNGAIHDFAGPYFIGIDNFAFGSTQKYVQLHIDGDKIASFNQSLEQADRTYKNRMHNICCDNCHSHVARVLNNYAYMGRTNWTMVDVWWMCISQSKYVSWGAVIKTYIGWIVIVLFTLAMVFLLNPNK